MFFPFILIVNLSASEKYVIEKIQRVSVSLFFYVFFTPVVDSLMIFLSVLIFMQSPICIRL